MGRRATVAYTVGPSEIMVHTRGDWIRVNRKLWHAQAVQLRMLEPALTEKVLDLATRLIHETFPQGVQDAIMEAIHEIDPRLFLSKQRLCKVGVDDRLRNNKAPNLINLQALYCFSRDHLLSTIKDRLELKGHKWMLGSNIEFTPDNRFFRQAGQEEWKPLRYFTKMTRPHQTSVPTGPRNHPVYHHKVDKTITLLQPDITEEVATAIYQQMMECENRLEMSSLGGGGGKG